MSPTPADLLRLALDLAADGRLSLRDAFAEATFGHPPMSRAVDQATSYLLVAADELGLDLTDYLDPQERGAVILRALIYAGATALVDAEAR